MKAGKEAHLNTRNNTGRGECRGSDEPVRARAAVRERETESRAYQISTSSDVVVNSDVPIKGNSNWLYRRQSRWRVSGGNREAVGVGPNIRIEESKYSAKGQARAGESVEDTSLTHVHLRTRGGRPVCTQRDVCRGGGVFLKN